MSKSSSNVDLQETAGFAGGLFNQARLAWRLLRDARVPGWVKLIPIAALVYFLSPIDLIPDFALPLVGEVDDVVVLLLALKAFVDLSPSGVVREHLEPIMGRQSSTYAPNEPHSSEVIDVPYRVLDQNES